MAVELPGIGADTNRPYCPPSNVIAVLQRLRSRNLPERIDTEYLRDAGVSEGTVGRTMFGLRFLRLVEGETPTTTLRTMVTSTDEEYEAALRGLLQEAYRDVFDVLDPATDSQAKFLNFFRRYTPASQRQRMVIFFLGMCREAGIQTLEAPRERTSSASIGAKARASASSTSRRPSASVRAPGTARSGRVEKPNALGRLSDGGGAGQTLFGVSEDDIGLLDEGEFEEVWSALGKIARARARAKRQQPPNRQVADEEGTAEDE